MFDGGFKESKEHSVVMEEVEGVVSVRSFKLFLQFAYTGRVKLGDEPPEDQISALIEFARLMGMLGVVNTEHKAAAHIEAIILKNRPYDSSMFSTRQYRESDENIRLISPSHIRDAACLPRGHEIRSLFAKAATETFVIGSSKKFKFAKEREEIPGFAMDLLEQLGPVLRSFTASNKHVYFREPFCRRECVLR
ncbi:hypothetical protein BJY00DRAFT_289926 [Aspergillus carlsbadensis]|nr:hypothetical protein BJY00DRAFT_289926 [Aspergillus carlsbadensis]